MTTEILPGTTSTSLPRRPVNRSRRWLSTAAVMTVAVGTTLAGAGMAFAAGPVSQATGQFLSGSALGADLANLVQILPATASNVGTPATVSQSTPLTAVALNAVTVDLGNGINLLGENSILTLGAVNQYAQADSDGSSNSASGAVTDAGAIGIGSPDVPQSPATLDVGALAAAAELQNIISEGTLTVGAVAATATQTTTGDQSGDYQIASLQMSLTSPALAAVTTDLDTALTELQPTLDGLPDVIEALPGVDPLADVSGVPDVTVLTDALTTVTTADGAITANLQTGAISINIEQVLATAGLDLNNLDPATELLPYITDALGTQLLPALTTDITDLNTQLSDAINAISVTVLGNPVDAALLAPTLNQLITDLTAPFTNVISDLNDTVITPLAAALSALLSLQVNVQETAAGTFTETALQITAAPTGPLAQVKLASAAVGPNAGPVPTEMTLDPDHGPAAGGTSVTITGTGFIPGQTTITIGENTIPADQVNINADGTTATFTTPAHTPGPVNVTITTPGGTSTPALTYTYDPIGPPVITTPGNGTTITTTTPTIGGTGNPGGTVRVTENTTLICTAAVNSSGIWTCVPNRPLAAGQHTFTATQTDSDGNTSGPSGPVTFTIATGSGPTLASTGPSLTAPLITAAVLMLLGAVLLTTTRRRAN